MSTDSRSSSASDNIVKNQKKSSKKFKKNSPTVNNFTTSRPIMPLNPLSLSPRSDGSSYDPLSDNERVIFFIFVKNNQLNLSKLYVIATYEHLYIIMYITIKKFT